MSVASSFKSSMKEEAFTQSKLEISYISSINSDLKQPQLNCSSSNKIVRICLNSDCKQSSLICNDIDCDKCGTQIHHRCPSIPFRDITEILNERADRQKHFLQQIVDIENRLIEEINKSRENFTKKYYFGDLEEKYLKIVEEIYMNENAQCLNGKQAEEFYKRLIRSNAPANQHGKLLLDNYKTTMEKLFGEIINLKMKTYESFVKLTDITKPNQLKIDSVILKKPLGTALQELKLYQSLISKLSKSLINELAKQQSDFLKEQLGNPKQLQLLYRGSDYSCSASVFHQKCDNIPNTLTLIRTQYGKTIAGFTKYSWNQNLQNFINDAGKNCFLLSLDLKEKMVPINEYYLMYCHPNFGPIFGGGNGYDLYIVDQCHANRNSSSNFPTTYNKEGQGKYPTSPESCRALTGGYYFRVVEYEVFKVIW